MSYFQNFKLRIYFVLYWMYSLAILKTRASKFYKNLLGSTLEPNTLNPNLDWVYIRKVKKVVNKYSFLFNSDRKCLLESMIAFFLLRKKKINSKINIGIAKENEELIAHAWLSVNDQIIIGGPIKKYVKLVYHESQ